MRRGISRHADLGSGVADGSHLDPDRPGSDALLLGGGRLQPMLVPPPEPDHPTAVSGALVFLNACRAGAAQPMLAREGGFVDAFLKAGAAAVLAPMWSVESTTAARLAGLVYQAVAAGVPLDEALRQARLALVGMPDRMAWVLYGCPGCVVEPSRPS